MYNSIRILCEKANRSMHWPTFLYYTIACIEVEADNNSAHTACKKVTAKTDRLPHPVTPNMSQIIADKCPSGKYKRVIDLSYACINMML